ncbi:Protein of unknown function [Arachidicoccus rhizosphaerae]|uniref:DUF3826 domain-containing protein n=1 Tax=Arachidicoccus rhizosphaerae TaxID=551991 RepID=A0A1H3X2M7_9BACT|nr:DUF3826 domain-containing protein [Arachidicoccus rhizosphaerae]SDZ92884.1 Protein of unknown function [Arachidicoccus rhizosphaerae]
MNKKNNLSFTCKGLFAAFLLFGLLTHTNTLYAQDGLDQEDVQKIHQKAAKWVDAIHLTEQHTIDKVTGFVINHLSAVYSWNKTHDFTEVPAGINPRTGERLTELDRKMIVQSSMPENVHQDLMDSLKRYLNEQQVEEILDGYTVGKVAFTLKGYQAIVPGLTQTETAVILKNLKLAREQAIDYKSMKAISAIFEIYKTKNEKYLNENGRNWHQLFKNYVNKVQAEKAAKQKR